MSEHRSMRLVAGCVAGLVLLGVTSCGSSGGAEPNAGAETSPSTTSDSSGSTTSTTEARGSTTTSAPAAATPVEAACAAMPWSLSEPAVLQENEPGLAGPEERGEALGQVEVLVPDDLEDAWAQWVALSTSSDPDAGSDLTDDQREELYSMHREVLLVAVEQCDDLAPTWGCLERSTFQKIGQAIGADDDVVASGDQTYPTPEEAIEASDNEGDAEWVEVDSTDGAVLFATLDDDGLVSGATRVEAEDDGWVAGGDTTCNDSLGVAAEERFEKVGEAIPTD